MRKCSVENCRKKHLAKGFCCKHYYRNKSGISITDKTKYEKTIKERFWEKVDKKDDDQCWLWKGSSNGIYGKLTINGKSISAHRLSYEIHFGEIPDGEGYHGTCVLHKCDTPLCANPNHLFLGSNLDNVQDMCKKGRHKESVKTHCPQGHEYTKDNLYLSKEGYRHCKICVRKRQNDKSVSTRNEVLLA